MVNINKAAAVNAMNLVGTALLSLSLTCTFSRATIEQLSSYQRNVKECTVFY